MSDSLEFEKVTKGFGAIRALDEVSFSIKKGEFFSLLGPSGCGKTTLLRLIAGFENLDSGRILLDGQDITNLPANKRPINTVFQSYALFPHLTVWDNIAFGLRIAKRSNEYIKKEVEAMLALIQMEEHAYKKPEYISGGQKQRVAIARALVNRPRVLLLDEPLAALDLKLRQRMLLELDLIHDEVGITFLYVTHDQNEAMAVSDRIAILNKGKLEQIGTPVELYEAPKSSFVAAFIGDTNFLDGWVAEQQLQEYSLLSIEDFPAVLCFNDKQLHVGDPVHISVRPEKIHISREQPEKKRLINIVEGIIEDIIYHGDHTKFGVRVGGHRMTILQQHSRFLLDEKPLTWNDKVWLWWHADDGFILERYQADTPSGSLFTNQKIDNSSDQAGEIWPEN